MSKQRFNILLFFKQTLLVAILSLVTACASFTSQHNSFRQVARDYFEAYAERSDFDRFMTFYDNNAELRDIVYGNYLQNKEAIRHFLDWNRGKFRLVSGERILTVTQQTLEGSIVITEGYFHAFEYDGAQLGPWLFNIKLELNDAGKIIKQTDWINYTPRDQFLGGDNMNDKLIKDRQ